MKTERTKPVSSNLVSAPANTAATYDQLFRRLVIEHPAPEISHDLYHMIMSGRIAWNMRADEGRLAGFSVVMSHQGDDADEPNGHPVPRSVHSSCSLLPAESAHSTVGALSRVSTHSAVAIG